MSFLATPENWFNPDECKKKRLIPIQIKLALQNLISKILGSNNFAGDYDYLSQNNSSTKNIQLRFLYNEQIATRLRKIEINLIFYKFSTLIYRSLSYLQFDLQSWPLDLRAFFKQIKPATFNRVLHYSLFSQILIIYAKLLYM